MKADEHPGRRTKAHGYQSAASWITDLISLKRFILLCPFCRVNFNPKRHRYRKFYASDHTGITDGHAVNGMCDACKGITQNLGGGTGFIHEEEYAKVCIDPVEARRIARAKAGQMSAWRYINRRK